MTAARSVSQVRAPAMTAAPAKDTPATERARGSTLHAAQANTEAAAPMAAEAIRGCVRALQADGGPLMEISSSARSLAVAVDRFGRVTLPRVNNAADETAQAARRLGRTVSGIGDNPQSLIYGPGRGAAGPGEPGFVAPAAQP